MTIATVDIVPPRRLGVLLAGARADRALSLDEVADRAPFSAEQLLAVEDGRLPLTEEQLDRVLEAYGVSVEDLLPARGQVVLDLRSKQLLVADEIATLRSDAPRADEVLSAYLSLVYVLRRAEPGTPVVLRAHDMAVLAKALDLAQPDVEARLHGLMAHPTEEVSRLTRLLRHKLTLPIVGVVVAAAALGTVLVLRAGDDPPAPAPAVQRTVPPASVIPPQVVERTTDGSSAVADQAP